MRLMPRLQVFGMLLDTDGESMQVWYDGQHQAFAADLRPVRTKAVRVDDPESWTSMYAFHLKLVEER